VRILVAAVILDVEDSRPIVNTGYGLERSL
jgi:hypothetical protein